MKNVKKTEPPPHFPVKTDEFKKGEWNGSKNYVDVLIKIANIDSTNPFPQFISIVTYTGFGGKYGKEENIDIRFTIPDDCYVKIKLFDQEYWNWTTEHLALTMKKNLDIYYKSYDVIDNGKTIIFKAKKNIKDAVNTLHRFYLNIEIKQFARMLPISIDPVIINPRPNEAYFEEIEPTANIKLNAYRLDLFR